MTPWGLKRNVELHTESNFFAPEIMRMFGDKMSNYGVRSVGPDWLLYRKTPVKDGIQTGQLFDKVTFQKTYPVGCNETKIRGVHV